MVSALMRNAPHEKCLHIYKQFRHEQNLKTVPNTLIIIQTQTQKKKNKKKKYV